MPTPRPLVMLAAAGAVMVPAAVGLSPAAAKTPTKHVICDKPAKWIPSDYTGGCYLTFSRAVRGIAYDAFEDAARDDAQWIGSTELGGGSLGREKAVTSMTCRRGGTLNGVRLNRFHAGWCTWTDTFGHFEEGDHPVHTWGCDVIVAVRSGPGGKVRTRRGRVELQWTITAAPFQDLLVVGGEYPYCGKTVPEDTWLQG